MDNPEKLATRGTQDTGRRHTKQKTQWIIHRNWEHETQNEDIQNKKHNFCFLCCQFLWIIHCVFCFVCLDNPEKLATRGTQDTGQRHTKQKTQWIIQRNWEHETQNEDIQNKKHNG
jgi:hypothetical protein